MKSNLSVFDGLEANSSDFDNLSLSSLQSLTEFTSQLGLKLQYYTMGIDELHLITQIQYAKKLKCKLLITQFPTPKHNLISPHEILAYAINQLHKTCSYAKCFNIKIAVIKPPYFNTTQMLQLIESVNHPYLGVSIDMDLIYQNNSCPFQVLANLSPYVFNLRFSQKYLSKFNINDENIHTLLQHPLPFLTTLPSLFSITIESPLKDNLILFIDKNKCKC